MKFVRGVKAKSSVAREDMTLAAISEKAGHSVRAGSYTQYRLHCARQHLQRVTRAGQTGNADGIVTRNKEDARSCESRYNLCAQLAPALDTQAVVPPHTTSTPL